MFRKRQPNEMTLTAKVKLLPDEAAAESLYATMWAYADACDLASELAFLAEETRPEPLQRELYRPVRGRFGLKAQMACSVFATVAAKYKALESSKREWTRIRFKRPQADLVWNRDWAILKDGTVSIGTLSGRVKAPFVMKGMERYFDRSKYRFGTAKLVLSRKGQFFLHVPVTFTAPALGFQDVKRVVGVDRGINFAATAYDDLGKTTFFSGRFLKQRRATFMRNRRDLQRRQTPSARRRLKLIGNRENRWSRDVNHRVAKALVEAYPAGTLFALEDLKGVRKATEAVRKKNRYVQVSWPFSDLGEKIKYKAQRRGSLVVEVDPAYTSQDCPLCERRLKSNRDKARHLFSCKLCGYRSNDDRVGAMNVYDLGVKWLDAQYDQAEPDYDSDALEYILRTRGDVNPPAMRRHGFGLARDHRHVFMPKEGAVKAPSLPGSREPNPGRGFHKPRPLGRGD